MQNQIKITLQPEIYKKLKENSKENMRTLSAEVNFMLKKAYDTDAKNVEVENENELETPYKVTLKTPTKANSIKTKLDEEDLLNDPLYDPDF